ncbi:Crp/Fnr family transcriptional regulator [Cecembia lonarensis]|uniref:Cyclic nucleotide-binding domain protein n=1 Tax=Cecembia lonarensis (strain CCUG 58316 / KCTC 22772 / LW9) TaxID=1225176 RepID=K1LWB8_CECL9|nr:Crp/Fnr family transcriptional regulator [Cecembia lonarensis]EKB48449.1 Cyclic nucleotide-binding domain protein [Cecembia lonarensis LW9]
MDSPFLKYLSQTVHVKQEHLPLLDELISRRQLKKNDVLLTAGQVCKHMFFVEEGLLRLFSTDENGKEHIVQFASENWFMSERGSLYFGTPSEFSIDVLEDSQLVVFDQEFIEKASSISAEFRTYNEYLLQNHIRHLQKRINLLIGASAEQRYIEFINLYADLTLRIPQWMIASYLGITPESLSRVRKGLSRQNFK